METRDVNRVVTLAKEMHQEGDYKNIPFHTDVFVSTISHCMRDGFAWVGEKDGKIVAGFLASINQYMFSRAKMASDYVYQLVQQYKRNQGYKDSRSIAARESAKAELRRLGYTVTGRKR